VKGAFTGAVTSRAGFFLTADGGTIFLDEISELGLPLQVKLLRVLQDKEVVMVGASRSRQVDVRILAASNKTPTLGGAPSLPRPLLPLNVIGIVVLPLRERGDDILLLVRHFTASTPAVRPAPRFSDAASRPAGLFLAGNVRELENRPAAGDDREPVIDVPQLPETMRFPVWPSPSTQFGRGGGRSHPRKWPVSATIRPLPPRSSASTARLYGRS
jgi:transcriptional regulator with PAS, ATPase and Fis domain